MDFKKRNEIRAEQLAFNWYPQVGDRVQLAEGAPGYAAWSSGTLIALTPSVRGASIEHVLRTVKMDDGGVLEEIMDVDPRFGGVIRNKLQLVPHEDYFLTDEDATE